LLDGKILDICCRSTNISLLWLAFFVIIPEEKNMQTIIVGTIVLIAFFFLFRHFYKAFTAKSGEGCRCTGCSGCPSIKACQAERFPDTGKQRTEDQQEDD
jgi:hypothetical protein